MTNSQIIRLALKYANMSISQLAEEMGMTKQSLSNRLKTDKFNSDEMTKFASIIGAKLVSYFEFPDGTKIGG
ncbi:MAG: helix-turn-helix domain-containing protein [Suipraeoptans sp.]